MANIIRKITVGKEVKESMNYVVGIDYTVYVDNKPTKRRLCNIEEEEDCYLVYLALENEHQLWKKLPKNDLTTVEYEID